MTVHCRAAAPSRPPNALKMPRRPAPIGCVPASLPCMSHDRPSTLERPSFAIPRLSLPAGLLISLGLIAIAAGLEHAMGRHFFCQCGTFKLWYGGRGGPGLSQHLTDWYSYSHVIHGIVFYGL